MKTQILSNTPENITKAANILKYTLSTALAVVLVWFAFRTVDWKTFWEDLQPTRWIWIALYFIAAIVAAAVAVYLFTSWEKAGSGMRWTLFIVLLVAIAIARYAFYAAF